MNISGSNSLYGVSAYSSSGSSSTSSTSAMATKFAEALLTSMDSDSSGSIDSAEFSSAALSLSSSSDATSITEAFSALDTNQDGVVGADELASSISSIMGQQGTMAAGGRPPPPPPPPQGGEDTDYTEDELTAMSSETSSTDSVLSALYETLATNFSAADTNSDGKVSSTEAMAYQESTKQSSTGTASNSQDAFMKKLMEQMVSSYANQNSTSTSAINLSA